MVIYYFGADHPFERLQQIGFKRRNTIILKTLTEYKGIRQVIAFNYTDRKTFLRHLFKNFGRSEQKIKDVYFTEIFVFGKLKIGFLNRLFNRLYFVLLWLQNSKHRVLAWVYWPNGYIDYKRSGVRPGFVFDADHSLTDDPNASTADRTAIEKLLSEVAQKSLLILSGSKLMLEWFEQRGNKNGYRLRNGIDLSRFRSPKQNKLDKFTVVYCGILSNWIDYELFIQVVKSNPEIDFVIIGKAFMNDTYDQLKMHKNVTLMGEKSAEEVSALLPQYYAGLGLYKAGAIDGDSMKIYEYLAAGLPVVCTNYHSSMKEDFNGLLFIGESADDFNKLITGIRDRGLKPGQEEVEKLLQQSTWGKRIDAAMEYIY